jgi:hypothetical protein
MGSKVGKCTFLSACVILTVWLAGCSSALQNSGGNGNPNNGDEGTAISVSISPPSASVPVNAQQQFRAVVTGSSNQAVTWAVDGITNGNASLGTISANGLYIAPSSAGNHTVSATSVADSSKSGSAVAKVTGPGGTASMAVVTRDYDNNRSGVNPQETTLTLSNVNPQQFGKLFTYQVDGYIYGQPLYVAGVNVPGEGKHNVVYVATQEDKVYAFDADQDLGGPLWETDFTNQDLNVTSVPCGDVQGCSIAPNIGITATPVISLDNNAIYVEARTKESGNYVHKLHALDLATGAEKFGGPVVIRASVSGTGMGSQNGVVSFDGLHENERSALLLLNGVVYISFASISDVPPYHGWILGYDAESLQQVAVFNATPNGNEGGYWSNAGITADANGNIFAVAGNGTPNGANAEYGQTFIKLSGDLRVLDYFTPFDASNMNATDLDIGSGGILLLPDQPGAHPHELVEAGKEGKIYVVDRDLMGHFNSSSDAVVQEIPNAVGKNYRDGLYFFTPTFWNGRVYMQGVNDVMKAFAVQNGTLSNSAVMISGTTADFPGARVIISANGDGAGIAWAEMWSLSDHTGTLHAYDANNLSHELWNSGMNGERDALGAATRMTAPLVVNGKVYVGATGHLTVYGLLK